MLLLFIMKQTSEKWQLLISNIAKGILQSHVYHVYMHLLPMLEICVIMIKKSSQF